jgi:hypothetical protein
MQKKREQQARYEASRQQFANMFAPTTPQTALAAPGRVGPTAARAGMIGQAPALDRNRLLSAMLDPNMPPDVLERAKIAYEATKPVETKAAVSALEGVAKQIPPCRNIRSTKTMRRTTNKPTVVTLLGEVSLAKDLEARLQF